MVSTVLQNGDDVGDGLGGALLMGLGQCSSGLTAPIVLRPFADHGTGLLFTHARADEEAQPRAEQDVIPLIDSGSNFVAGLGDSRNRRN